MNTSVHVAGHPSSSALQAAGKCKSQWGSESTESGPTWELPQETPNVGLTQRRTTWIFGENPPENISETFQKWSTKVRSLIWWFFFMLLWRGRVFSLENRQNLVLPSRQDACVASVKTLMCHVCRRFRRRSVEQHSTFWPFKYKPQEEEIETVQSLYKQ